MSSDQILNDITAAREKLSQLNSQHAPSSPLPPIPQPSSSDPNNNTTPPSKGLSMSNNAFNAPDDSSIAEMSKVSQLTPNPNIEDGDQNSITNSITDDANRSLDEQTQDEGYPPNQEGMEGSNENSVVNGSLEGSNATGSTKKVRTANIACSFSFLNPNPSSPPPPQP